MLLAARVLCISVCGIALLHLRVAAAPESVTVTVVGKLRTGVFAIGGETTGTTITADGITWELDCGADELMRQVMEKFDGRTIVVHGSLQKRNGIESKDRWIVMVAGLEAVENTKGVKSEEPRLSIATDRSDARFCLVQHDDLITLDITSPSGIGKATITRKKKEWPTSIVVRLHLRGLESFKMSSRSVTVEAAISSTGEHQKRVYLRNEGSEESIDMSSPYWTDVQIVGERKSIPLKDGYFEIKLPEKLFEHNSTEVTLRWIDFFRG